MTQHVHARDLVELAGLVAMEGPAMVADQRRIAREDLQQYWSASKCRLDRWGGTLRKYQREVGELGTSWARREWPLLVPVFEEVVSGEILTRVWTAVLLAHDSLRHECELEPVARSVLIGHVESRRSVLKLLTICPTPHEETGRRVDKLRRQSERWTDLLIGYLSTMYDVDSLAFDAERARDFGQSVRTQVNPLVRREAQNLALASLRSSFQRALSPESPNADLNARLATGIVSCFPPGAMEPTCVGRSLWLAHVQHTADNAEEMIEGLMRLDC